MALRLSEFVDGQLDGIKQVIVVAPDASGLREYLRLPDTVEYIAAAPDEAELEANESTILVVTVGPDTTANTLRAELARAPGAGSVLLLFGWGTLDLPWHRVLDPVTEADLQVVDVATVSSSSFPTAAFARRGERLAVPRPYLGPGRHALPEPLADDAAERRLALRMAGELAFVGLQERKLRALTEAQAATIAQQAKEISAAKRELDRAKAETAAERLRTEKAAAKARQLERSTTMAVGRAVVEARNLRGVRRLPGTVMRIRKQRHRSRS